MAALAMSSSVFIPVMQTLQDASINFGIMSIERIEEGDEVNASYYAMLHYRAIRAIEVIMGRYVD